TLDRREFLTRTGLTLAVAATPSGLKVFALGKADTESDLFQPRVWYNLSADNQLTVMVNKVEMGQGTHTALPMIVADELDVKWEQVQIEQAPTRREYYDPPRFTRQGTGGSSGVRNMYEPLRKAGAAGREMLIEAAAQKWKVPVGECQTSEGKVHHKPSGRSFTYGELVEEASQLPVPENPRLKDKSEFKIMRKPIPRLDIPAKVSGEAKFGIDTFVPGMLYGVVARAPVYGAAVVSYDEQAAKAIPGVRHVVKVETPDIPGSSPRHAGIAVCAETLEAAWKGREALNIEWSQGERPTLSTETVDRDLVASLEKQGLSARDDGDVQGAIEQAHKRVQAEYHLPYLSHATMEPMNCTVHVQPDRCDIWIATQGQSRNLDTAVEVTGLKPEQIHVHATYLGCGLGRRGRIDFGHEALQIGKAVGEPVKVIWTREEDMQYDLYRPGNSHRITGALDEEGRVTAWSHKVVAPQFSVREGSQVDSQATSGLTRLQYQIPNVSVDWVRLDNPIPVTYWRSVGSSHNGFTVESFMDELAHAAGKDPVEFRLQHLKENKRLHRVLELVAEKAGWGKPLAGAEGRGIAAYNSYRSYVAQVAEVSVDRKTGRVKVHRVVCAIDCGPWVNPDTIQAQMMGAITMGLSAAFKEKVHFADGGVKSANFFDYQLLRMSESFDVEVHIVDSDDAQGGVGEPGLPPAAPAVANAIFAATGARIRRLPMTPERILQALSSS
ncbi:xanthine dehydrogenase family protein molybdopterin-binding subunit, partial [Acidobacteria bacterium AH-259-D05]|nr:xanthine dehydrogenase family protein molybdopterin-binding subunit [Acidobacteria bacterium AH-259-D05]